jgi:hypothetical protein
MHKDAVRRIILGLAADDAIVLLSALGSLVDLEPTKGIALKDPAIYHETIDPVLLAKIRDKGVVPSVPVAIHALHGQRFNILLVPAATVIAAGTSRGVSPHYIVVRYVLCVPGEYAIRGGGARWELYRRGHYTISFFSDAIAIAMSDLGVKID